MSFISNIFGGASNQFNPTSPYAPGTQATVQNFQPQIDTANQNYGQANTGLQSLAQQLQLQSQGGGPNLANALLQQATGQNVANQAALLGGQRGASQNVGLMARQIGQQGAGIQQQAAGQASINRLQQQLASQQQLGGVLGTQGQLANQNYGITQGALSNQNSSIVGAKNNQNEIGSNQAHQNAQMNQGIIGGVANAAGSLLGLANGGMPQQQMPMWHHNFLNKQTQHFQSGGNVAGMHFAPMNYKQGGQVPGQPQVQGNNPKNDTVPAMLSPQEIVIPNSVTQSNDPVGNGAKFIAQVMAGKHRGKK